MSETARDSPLRNFHDTRTGDALQNEQPDQGEDTGLSNSASSSEFLRWTAEHDGSPDWTSFGCVHHANNVHFEFRCHEVHSNNLSVQDLMKESRELNMYAVLSSWAFEILPEDLHELSTLWTPKVAPNEAHTFKGKLQAAFWFHSSFDPRTWQIRRVLSCMIWTEGAPLPQQNMSSVSSQPFDLKDLRDAILRARNVRGRESVWSALLDSTMVLRPVYNAKNVEWVFIEATILPDFASHRLNTLSLHTQVGSIIIRRVHCAGGLDQLEPDPELQPYVLFPRDQQDTQSGDSMIIIRSSDAHINCPTFCLFILSQGDFDSIHNLHRLLEDAYVSKRFYGSGDELWKRADWKTLLKWRKAVAAQAETTMN